ncbi:MAG: lytic transglycosylase domain-containing protein [Oligoflexia bacterium]|nr:lytic transglycosylase domain-containing protein [Oligoflexia bacterium]
MTYSRCLPVIFASISCLGVTIAGVCPAYGESTSEIAAEQRESRLSNARELLGKYYHKSVVLSGEHIRRINNQVYRLTNRSLPKAYKGQYKKIAQAIVDESLRYDFDPVFIASVIINESSFNPKKIGSAGEIGLMQVRPQTAEWIAKRSDIRWRGAASLRNPVINIRLGTAYLSYLRERFDSHARLYLAAYNMGQTNVDGALEHNVWPRDYPMRVMRYYIQYYREISSE